MPSCMVALLPFALLWLAPAGWRLLPLACAAAVAVTVGVVAVRALTERVPVWGTATLAGAYLIVMVQARAAVGRPGVSAVLLLLVLWLALFGTRRWLWRLLTTAVLMWMAALILVAGTDWLPSVWRVGILFVTVAGIVGVAVQALVRRVRGRGHEYVLGERDGLADGDVLSGLADPGAWEAELDRDLARARRHGEPVSVALIEIDSFVTADGVVGACGEDGLLRQIAGNWLEVLRPEDVLARVSADEFAVLISGCSNADAAGVISRLRARMPEPCSCSIALVTWDGLEVADQLISRVGYALRDAPRDRQPQADEPERGIATVTG